VDRLHAAQGMYITYAGLPADVLAKKSAVVRQFLSDFRVSYGHDPASEFAIYGAAVAQLTLKAIAASDGTRTGVRLQLFGGLKVPAAESLLAADTGIDHITGETISRQLTVEVLRHHVERFYREMDLASA
jgi:branched-chain amino acid transport system substrate-binding protein